MSLNFRMLLLFYHYIIVYADYIGIMLLRRSDIMWFYASRSLSYPSKKDEDLWNRIGGSVCPIFQRVQIIYEIEFSYASFMLSLRCHLCVFYTDYASTKNSPKKFCYVNTILLRLFML